MNVFDFDNTIFRGDSTARFIAFCVRRHPALLADLPGQLINALKFALKLKPKQAFKQRLFACFARLDDPLKEVETFWDKEIVRVKAFYKALQRPDDVVISASPEFIVRPACARLGIREVMASPVDPATGRYSGANCHGAEKVRRFLERFPDGHIEAFYSDSHSDDPMAALAERACLVKGEALLPWDGW